MVTIETSVVEAVALVHSPMVAVVVLAEPDMVKIMVQMMTTEQALAAVVVQDTTAAEAAVVELFLVTENTMDPMAVAVATVEEEAAETVHITDINGAITAVVAEAAVPVPVI